MGGGSIGSAIGMAFGALAFAIPGVGAVAGTAIMGATAGLGGSIGGGIEQDQKEQEAVDRAEAQMEADKAIRRAAQHQSSTSTYQSLASGYSKSYIQSRKVDAQLNDDHNLKRKRTPFRKKTATNTAMQQHHKLTKVFQGSLKTRSRGNPA